MIDAASSLTFFLLCLLFFVFYCSPLFFVPFLCMDVPPITHVIYIYVFHSNDLRDNYDSFLSAASIASRLMECLLKRDDALANHKSGGSAWHIRPRFLRANQMTKKLARNYRGKPSGFSYYPHPTCSKL